MNASDDRLRRNRQNHVGRGLKAEVLIGCETHKLIRETDKNRDRWGLTNLDYSRTKRKKRKIKCRVGILFSKANPLDLN